MRFPEIIQGGAGRSRPDKNDFRESNDPNAGFAGRKNTHTKMQIRLFSIPIGADDAATEEMNHFLRANEWPMDAPTKSETHYTAYALFLLT